ncbi:Uncharacterized protein GBIM_10004 [Gryllus bimaculatus]|nr:Uncharacterized protein GBIM_10004 [Gryllus bimaculatus]
MRFVLDGTITRLKYQCPTYEGLLMQRKAETPLAVALSSSALPTWSNWYVYLLQHGKKVHKKKTSTKRGERSPIFNEAIIFSVPAHTLQMQQKLPQYLNKCGFSSFIKFRCSYLSSSEQEIYSCEIL